MFVHWKSLIVLGFVFWILLCLNDIFGGAPKYHLEEDYDQVDGELFDDSFSETPEGDFAGKILKFGWSILIWNTVTFFFSVLFCSCSKTVIWMLIKLFLNKKSNRLNFIEPKEMHLNPKSDSSLSKIPVKVRSGLNATRSSDTNVEVKPKVNSNEVSCPNLLPDTSKCNPSQGTVPEKPQCQTIYQNNKVFSPSDNEIKRLDHHFENQCTTLREEISRLRSASLKEHAVLSRKLEAVSIERKDLSKKLTIAQKENRAAKQQLEELLQEKAVLIKRFETATKELKCNTKSKKMALQKLDEVIAGSENLRTQLEQVTRDKEILEGKLKLLEGEYEKLQERVMASNQRHFQNFQEHTPERDTNSVEANRNPENEAVPQESRTETNAACVSQTELDMKKIQVKIKQLEKNLENFSATKTELSFTCNEEVEGSDGNISVRENADIQMKSSDETDISETMSPHPKFWTGRPTDVIHALVAHKLNERGRFLDNIREYKSEHAKIESEMDEYSSVESLDDVRPPQRIVSSSRAFQNFLKCLPTYENRKRSFSSHSDLNF